MRINKIKALFKLGIEDLLKNMNVFIYIIIPIGFPVIVILAWGIISIIMFNTVYKKVRVDN